MLRTRRINGTIRDESPLPLPIKMGLPSLGGPMVTRGGVAFLGSALDYYLRAYDVRSGETCGARGCRPGRRLRRCLLVRRQRAAVRGRHGRGPPLARHQLGAELDA